MPISFYQLLYPFIEVTATGTKFIHADALGDILAGSRFVVVVMLFLVTFYCLDNTLARSCFRTVVYQLGIAGFLQIFLQLFAAFLTTGITLCKMVNAAKSNASNSCNWI